MSRSGYHDDCDNWDLIRYRGAVASAIKGKRGQQLLRELRAALDEMQVKELISGELEADGKYCALGVVGYVRGIDMSQIDVENSRFVAETFGIADALAREIVFINDEDGPFPYYNSPEETPAQRWKRVRKWVEQQIIDPVEST